MAETTAYTQTTFRDDIVEKVGQLSSVLDSLSEHPMLRGNLALHGGTALNLFIMEPARLSLDLDLNYIASEDRARMLADQQCYVDAVCAIAKELGFDPHAGRLGHAGCTVKLHYRSSITGLPDFVKVDLNFLNRVCLLPPEERVMTFGDFGTRFLVNSAIEVIAGKIKAVTERTVPRDLFDLIRIERHGESWTTGNSSLDHRIVFYNALLSNRFPNHGDLADGSRFEERESDFEHILRPVLPLDSGLTYDTLLEESLPILEKYVIPCDSDEKEFSEKLSKGVLDTDLLFGEHPDIAYRAARNPVALHKARGIKAAIERGII